MTTTAEFIAGFEGYAGRAYWDVNAWRLGYGSDTEGQDQIKVTEGMETTKPRALQNLALRIPQFQTIAVYGKTGMGADTWSKLTEHQKSAITSLVYNYGRLPIIITPSDPEKTAAAIKALQSANGGVNRERRIAEAAFYLTPDVAAAPKPIPRAPSPQIPVPSAPPPAASAGHPQISATIAGLDAAILDHFASIRDALIGQRDALNIRIAKIEAQAADFAQLEGAGISLPAPPLPATPATPAATIPAATTTQGSQEMPAIINLLIGNWKTTLSGVAAAAGQGVAAKYPEWAPVANWVTTAGLAALGITATDAKTVPPTK